MKINTTMSLRTILCAILLAVVAACALATPADAASADCADNIQVPYLDTLPTHPYYEDVMWMQSQGFIAPAVSFRPDAPITLAEAITFEERIFDIPSVINSWDEWADETYWVRGGQLAVGCYSYGTETSPNLVACTLFGAAPMSRDVLWSGDFSAIYGIETSAIFYDSLKAYGLVENWWTEDTTITRGEFCHIVHVIVEEEALKSDTVFLINEEYKVYTYGYTEEELTEEKKSELFNNAFDAINLLPVSVREAYLNSDCCIHIANECTWDYIKSHHIGSENAAAFVENHQIWIGAQYLYDRDILIHEFGHICHNLAGCPRDLLEGLYAEADRICTMTGDSYAATNSNECFAEAFMMYVAHDYQFRSQVPDLSHYIEDMINLAAEGGHTVLRAG